MQRYSRRVKWIKRAIEASQSMTTSPKQELSNVSAEGIFAALRSVDPISTAGAWKSSSSCNSRSECEIHIRVAIPSFAFSPFCECKMYIFIVQLTYVSGILSEIHLMISSSRPLSVAFREVPLPNLIRTYPTMSS